MFLFEYVNKEHPEINAIWVSPNADVVAQVVSYGYKSVVSNTWKGVLAQLRAGKVFYTNGIDDFGRVCFFYGAKTIALWHGVGIKRIYYNLCRHHGIKLKLKKLKDRIYSWTYRDCTISTSKLANDFFASSFLVPPQKIIITGQPRNDVFKENIKPRDVLPNFKNADKYEYILYMPTYRPYKDNTIYDTIAFIAQNKEFLIFMRENNVRFLLKLHYLTKLNGINLPPEIIILKNEDVSSSQELLAISDILITDFSSCIIDYTIRKKPAYLFAPDYELYCEKVGLLQPWPDIYKKYSINSIENLIDSIKTSIKNSKDMLDVSTLIYKLYEDEKIQNTCYSENVYNHCYLRL